MHALHQVHQRYYFTVHAAVLIMPVSTGIIAPTFSAQFGGIPLLVLTYPSAGFYLCRQFRPHCDALIRETSSFRINSSFKWNSDSRAGLKSLSPSLLTRDIRRFEGEIDEERPYHPRINQSVTIRDPFFSWSTVMQLIQRRTENKYLDK